MKFECSKCGECCKTMERGLLLRESETKLFPSSSIKDFPNSKNNLKIMTKIVCPNYSNKKGCLIYENRPFVCRVYPFYFNPASGPIIDNCSNCETGTSIEMTSEQIRLLRKFVDILIIPELTKGG